MDPPNRCFARYTAGGRGVTVSDHGFRVDQLDTMFYAPTNWNGGNTQSWRADPLTAAAGDLPTDVDSAGHMKKRTLLPEWEVYEAEDDQAWDSPPPPEPTHLEYPPSRVKRAMRQLEAASPASRPASSAPTETSEVEIEKEGVEQERVEKEKAEDAFTEWRNASMSTSLELRAENEYCDAGKALELVDDMDQLYGYCDCIGWEGDD